jgi:Dolichyl-phosphate-mannose-protein mannosyltransferase
LNPDNQLFGNFRGTGFQRSAVAIWLYLFALALILYFLWNEPLRRIAIHLISMVISFGFLLVFCGLGFPLVRWLVSEQDKWIQCITSVAFGMGLTAILILLLGIFGSFNLTIFWVWVILGIFFFIYACTRWRPFNLDFTVSDDWGILSVCAIATFVAVSIPFIVAPEVSSDALAYHLLVPKMYLTAGKITHLPLFVAASYPSLAEYNYLLILRLSNEIVCKCFHFWVTILLLICISRVSRRINSKGSSLLAPALFLSMPITAIHMGWAWNDFIFTLMIVLSLYYLMSYYIAPEEASWKNFLVAGLMAGLASWTKYFFAIYFLALLPVFLVGVRRWKWNTPRAFLFFGAVGLVASFWVFQNWKLTGNPVYPFLNGIFRSPYWTETANAYFYKAVRRWEIPDWKWTTYFTFPVLLFMKPRLIDVHTGILPLILSPFFFVKSSTKGITFLKIYIISCAVVWLFVQSETRSLFVLLALYFCVISAALQNWEWPAPGWERISKLLIILSLSANLFITLLTTYHLFDPIRYFVGLESKAQYLKRMADSQPAYEYLNSKEDVRKVLLVGLHGPFYLKKPFLFSSFTDPAIAEVLTIDARTPGQIRDKLHSLGVTHIVVNRKNYDKENKEGLYSWQSEQKNNFQTFIQKECHQVASYGQDVILGVK